MIHQQMSNPIDKMFFYFEKNWFISNFYLQLLVCSHSLVYLCYLELRLKLYFDCEFKDLDYSFNWLFSQPILFFVHPYNSSTNLI